MTSSQRIDDEFEVQLDRLVDGEMSADEYRRFVAALDDRPDGYRRCALAFLEAQAWRSELPALAEESETVEFNTLNVRSKDNREEVAPGKTAACIDRPFAMSMEQARVMVVSACLIIAFMLGFETYRWISGPASPVRGGNVVSSGSASSPRQNMLPGGVAEADRIAESNLEDTTAGVATVSPATVSPATDSNVAASDPDVVPSNLSGFGATRLVLRQVDDSGTELDVPVYPMEEQYVQYALDTTRSFPADARQRFLENGYDVRQGELRLIPVVAENGYQVLVPYGEVEITQLTQNDFH